VPDTTLTFGLKASQQHATMDQFRQLWTTVEEGGFDSCWVFDHFAPMGHTRTGDIFEAWTILAAMAQVTRHLRIGTVCTGNIYRHPGILAKMAVTVDHISGGRLTLGLGAGGDDYADTMLGLPAYPARERIERLAEACQVLTRLWTEESVTFTGKYYHLEQAQSDPKPVQRPRPPLWIGSSGERYGLRAVAEHADGWLNASFNPDDVSELTRLSGILDRHCEDIGRDPATLRRAVQFRLPDGADDTLRAAERHAGIGFADIIFMPFTGGLRRVEELAELLPKLRTIG
jgi:alkanesulfonate monooxygenase SsuD/methylene tetrahydromethanopterin reductase-like flavin-dependent oxidoreductase (luciferase family)